MDSELTGELVGIFEGLRARIAELERELIILRRILALGHGCRTGVLYGDDGELQCSECGCDFKRNSVEVIANNIARRNLCRAAVEGRCE